MRTRRRCRNVGGLAVVLTAAACSGGSPDDVGAPNSDCVFRPPQIVCIDRLPDDLVAQAPAALRPSEGGLIGTVTTRQQPLTRVSLFIDHPGILCPNAGELGEVERVARLADAEAEAELTGPERVELRGDTQAEACVVAVTTGGSTSFSTRVIWTEGGARLMVELSRPDEAVSQSSLVAVAKAWTTTD